MQETNSLWYSHFTANKNLIKDLTYSTIKQFLRIFKPSTVDLLQLTPSSTFSFLFLNDNQESSPLFDQETFIIINKEKQYCDWIFIDFLHENFSTLNPWLLEEFYLNYLSYVLNIYTIKRLWINFDLFKKTFKSLLLKLFSFNHLTFNEIHNHIHKHLSNTNTWEFKTGIVNFIMNIFILKHYPNNNNINNQGEYLEVLFTWPSNLKLYLSQQQQIHEIQNKFNYIFNKNYFNIKKNNIELFKLIVNRFINLLITEPISSYENFIYIWSDILLDKDTWKYIKRESFSIIIWSILNSNNGLLHKWSVNYLGTNKVIDKEFLKKYINIYDVLDGFNCHLFKSLNKEIEFIIDFLNKTSNVEEMKITADGLFISNNSTNVLDLPINYFIILSRKIFNHNNSRIHKFFIKEICKMQLTNEVFSHYLMNDFIRIINSPLLYPENDMITYHSKMGLIIAEFFKEFLKHNKKYIFSYINGISKYATGRKIFMYWMDTLKEVIVKGEYNKDDIFIALNIKTNNWSNEGDEIISSWECIINSQMRTFSHYNRNLYWETVCETIQLLMNNSICLTMETNAFMLKNIYYEWIQYWTRSTSSDQLNIEYWYIGNSNNKSHINLFKATLLKIVNSFYEITKGKNIDLTDKNEFISQNNLSMIQETTINTIYFSLSLLFSKDILIDYITDNSGKIFSSYLPNDTKISIWNQIDQILNLSKIFNIKLDIPKSTFEHIYYNMKTLISENSETDFISSHFRLFEKIMFDFIDIYKTGIDDLLLNQYQITLIKDSHLLYRSQYIKMGLYNWLTCIHFEIYKTDDLKTNKMLITNIKTIYQELVKLFISYGDKLDIIVIKCISLCFMVLNTIEIDVLSLGITPFNNIGDLFTYYDIVESYDIFYLFKLFHFFFKCNSNTVVFEDFIVKGIKVWTEKRESFTYVNTWCFLNTIFTPTNLVNTDYIPLILGAFNKVFLLNEHRNWWLLKLSCEILLQQVSYNPELISIYKNILIQMCLCKETRGDDSSMLETSPYYIKSPFNISVKKVWPFNDKISKHGWYVRYGVLKYFEELIHSNIDSKVFVYVQDIILTVIREINALSGNKPEMQFTEKHRKKLRLGQLLLLLGKIFNNNKIKDYINMNIDKMREIEVNTQEVLQKINLYSVDFYIYQFSILLCSVSRSYKDYLFGVLTDPKSKMYLVTAAIVISSICIIENVFREKQEIDKFINALTIQCTSSLCSIRGFAQYFINKIDSFIKIDNNYWSSSFLTYLRSNQNIQKFFKRFDEKYNWYVEWLNDCNIDNIWKSNFDEIYSEIIPIDILTEFRVQSNEFIINDNQDYTKANNSWRFCFDTDNEVKIETGNGGNSQDDYQKKYRPIDVDIYHNKTRKRLDIIVIASLIDKIPNLGGLARTCEVFNMGSMTIASETVLNDTSFLSAAASAERWVPLITVPPCSVKEYILSYKKWGYKIIGLEQTQNSIEIKKFNFTEKSVIVLGNEKEGIPQDLITLIDNCVVIPQYGEIRSWNVHVSAALMLWEIVNCLKK